MGCRVRYLWFASHKAKYTILEKTTYNSIPVLPEYTQRRSLTANIAAPFTDVVIARIQKRDQLTAAKLTAAKRP